MEENHKILVLDEILDLRARKKKELVFYTLQLEELRNKLYFIQREIDLTNNIIDMIEKERVMDLKKYLNDRTT
jgi:hypothetical protein